MTPYDSNPLQVHSVMAVARLVGVSERSVRRLITGGELPAVRIGRRVGVRQGDLEAFLERCRVVR